MELLLAADDVLADQRHHEHTALATALGDDWHVGLVLFGCARIGRDALAGLREMGVEPVAFSDNDATRWGTTVDRLPVIPPHRIAGSVASPRIIVAAWRSGPILVQLRDLGLQASTSFKALFWHRPDRFLPYMRMDLPSRIVVARQSIARLSALLEEPRSRRELASQIDWLAASDPYPLATDAGPAQYFEFGLFKPRGDDVIVDCGAYTGDTARDILALWPRGVIIHAIEPEPANLACLEVWRSSLPDGQREAVVVHPFATSDRRRTLRFSSAGPGSCVEETGELVVDACALDELFAHSRVTFIKMDIEGAEPETLRGAIEVMRRDAPIVAACLYHRQEHLWEIPLLLHEHLPDHRLFLRRYGDEYGDVVCYAVPPGRLLR